MRLSPSSHRKPLAMSDPTLCPASSSGFGLEILAGRQTGDAVGTENPNVGRFGVNTAVSFTIREGN
jgi:hypothetical protein